MGNRRFNNQQTNNSNDGYNTNQQANNHNPNYPNQPRNGYSQPNPNYQQHNNNYQQPNNFNPKYQQGQYQGAYSNQPQQQVPPQSPINPKSKKHFYKRWWFWLILIVLVIIAIVSGGSGGSSSKTAKSHNKTEKTASNQKSNNPKKDGASLTDFKAIKLGTSDGSTEQELEDKFGSPSTTSTQTIENIKASDKIWNKVQNGDIGANFTVGFSNGKAISKAITGLKVKRDKKITLNDFNSIQNGQSIDDITKKFGQPNGYSETNIDGQESEDLTYDSGINGDMGANLIINTQNGQVSGKTQTQMK
ncbi:DUF3862 domain-containing protein [Bombilactobacillus folatiphilus]|uniref:DUF3862 domain-containing protein n=1 Tax=Bombilactobacillus folatiphilus TaxID=2923362 RepID=A0ABY4PAL1_9LACO|nr:DUF3862 domain-containing protein [Bombilactobacillus folatiphilus]UQS82576.1 DUF3862 domain-containing protein [Bombilactobacillus folatiphilus]